MFCRRWIRKFVVLLIFVATVARHNLDWGLSVFDGLPLLSSTNPKYFQISDLVFGLSTSKPSSETKEGTIAIFSGNRICGPKFPLTIYSILLHWLYYILDNESYRQFNIILWYRPALLGTGLGTWVGIRSPLLLDVVVLFLSFCRRHLKALIGILATCQQFLIHYELFDMQVIDIQNCERGLCHLTSIPSSTRWIQRIE